MHFSFPIVRALACLLILASPGCGRGRAGVRAPSPESVPVFGVRFTDITRAAGIDFTHNNGAFGGKLLPETMGAGLAFLDFDGDLDSDLFVVNGRDWTAAEIVAFKTASGEDMAIPLRIRRRGGTCRLYQNNGNGTFTDVSAGSGVDVSMFGMGATVGDYDNDGDSDLFVTALGRNYLFRNTGPGHFTDVSAAAGLTGSGWSTSAAFLDYDRDGNLDLFVCHYVMWSPAGDIFTSLDGESKAYAPPESYVGETCRLYKNLGNGSFRDVSAPAGIASRQDGTDSATPLRGKSLGATVTDIDSDGWPDIVVANDTEPNYVFRNNGRGGFEEIGPKAGIAFSDSGTARSGRGVDAGDIMGQGRDSIVLSHFAGQQIAAYRNEGGGRFTDIAADAGLVQTSAQYSGFGVSVLDLDNDGRLDIVNVNGHLEPGIETLHPETTYAQRPLIFWALEGRFIEIGAQAGADFAKPMVARGLACADIDLDGDLDLAVTTNGGPLRLFRSEGGNAKYALRLILTGSKSNRSGIGAQVEVKVGGRVYRRALRAGSSYLSQSEIPLTIGMGDAITADSVTVKWPSGSVTHLSNVPTSQILQIREGSGIESSQPFYPSR
jgi:hypothetical protein